MGQGRYLNNGRLPLLFRLLSAVIKDSDAGNRKSIYAYSGYLGDGPQPTDNERFNYLYTRSPRYGKFMVLTIFLMPTLFLPA